MLRVPLSPKVFSGADVTVVKERRLQLALDLDRTYENHPRE